MYIDCTDTSAALQSESKDSVVNNEASFFENQFEDGIQTRTNFIMSFDPLRSPGKQVCIEPVNKQANIEAGLIGQVLLLTEVNLFFWHLIVVISLSYLNSCVFCRNVRCY